MIKRIFVEKRKGFDTESQGLLNELKNMLGGDKINSLRLLNRYDIDNIDEKLFEKAKNNIFSEKNIDIINKELKTTADQLVFGSEYLPGQYDQRADSAVQCIKLFNSKAEPIVRFARVYIIEGNLSQDDVDKIKKYVINPVDSREADLKLPDSLNLAAEHPEKVKTIEGFCKLNNAGLTNLIDEMGLAMSPEDIAFVRDYFLDEGRDPTITEIKVIDTYWSDHCRHTTFNTELKNINFEEGKYSDLIKETFNQYLEIRKNVYGDKAKDRDICLMDLGTIGAKYLKKNGKAQNLDESDEINACSIKVKAEIDGKEEDWLVMFKNETHNHPTEIEPFGGAATCLGGAIRDPLSGRVYVYQAMRVTGSGDPRTPIADTLPGKLPQYKITRDAAKGYSSYGNQIGLATGLVDEIYNDGYVAKRMEVGAVIGAAPAKNVIRKKPKESDVIILVGGRTGRDGIGGATGSSKEHDEESVTTAGAEVQKGNPPVERNIQRLFRRNEVTTLIKKCNDFGAGGVSVAIGELADSIDVELDKVPKKYEGLDGTELAISESQERMAVVVAEEDADKFIGYSLQENLEATVVARVTDTGRFRMNFKGDTILDISREFLDTNGIKQQRDILVKNETMETVKTMEAMEAIETISDKLPKNHSDDIATQFLNDINCGSKKGLIDRFDSTIGTGTVLMPLGGKNQLTPILGMASKLPVTDGETNTTTLMTYGFDPEISKISPYHGAYYAVLDSVAKIVATGGNRKNIRLTFQEYFEKLGTDPYKWSKPFRALLGAFRAQMELEIPSIGGKDSMSGTFMDMNVPPTLISFAVDVTNADNVISPEFKKTDSNIVLLDLDKDENMMPLVSQFKENMDRVSQLTEEGKILSANTVSTGGMFISIIKMAVGNGIGATITEIFNSENNTGNDGVNNGAENIYSQRYGSLVLEIDKKYSPQELFAGLNYKVIGHTSDKREVSIANQKITMDDISKTWGCSLESVFPTRTEQATEDETIPSNSKPNNDDDIEKIKTIFSNSSTSDFKTNSVNVKGPKLSIARPNVVIPVFPGTNCEVDSKLAFERAGADVTTVNIRNLNPTMLEDSIEVLEHAINKSQIIMIPGGFSGGDEPDGSAKFITAVFRNERIREAVDVFLKEKDGLMLGICNGFQALIKLGLVPYGEIREIDEHSPTLTYNTIGRHVSTIVRTKVMSSLSPWLAETQVGDVYKMPVSHGEGRFVASEQEIARMIENGQVATTYVDGAGNPTMDIDYNPNGSVCAIEGITSPDGRIFGKMGHAERIGKNLYKNIPGEYDARIFEAGVKYFK